MILVFNNSTTSVTVEIPITDDSIPEGIESFDVKLRPFSPFPTSAMIVSPRVAVVLIRDDDGKYPCGDANRVHVAGALPK